MKPEHLPIKLLKTPNMPNLNKTLSRHLIGLMLAGIAVFLLPILLDMVDNTGESSQKLKDLSFFADPFKLMGGVLFFVGLHLFVVVKRNRVEAS